MKTSEEMTRSLFKRRDEYLTGQRRRRTAAVKIAGAGSVTCCVAAAAVVGANILRQKNAVTPDTLMSVSASGVDVNSNSANSDSIGNSQTSSVQSSPTIAEIPENVIWSKDSADGMEFFIDTDYEFCLRYGKQMTWELSGALNEYDDDSVFAVSLLTTGGSLDYVYNGRTIIEMYNEEEMYLGEITSLEDLLKSGDELKYGEMLYTTGTPDGVKWAKEYYDRTVESIGEEILNKYIVNGEFLKEKLEADIEAAGKVAKSLCDEIIIAKKLSLKAAFENTISELKAKNIPFELRELKYMDYNSGRNIIIIYISENDLADLELSEQDSILFGFASKNANGEDIVYDMMVE